jgi:hypothetical protein
LSVDKGPMAWLAMKFFDWLAKRRGKPTEAEMDEAIEGYQELSNFKARYSQNVWQKILDTNHELRRMIEHMGRRTYGGNHLKEDRLTLASIRKWIRDNEERLPK